MKNKMLSFFRQNSIWPPPVVASGKRPAAVKAIKMIGKWRTHALYTILKETFYVLHPLSTRYDAIPLNAPYLPTHNKSKKNRFWNNKFWEIATPMR